MGTKIAPEVPVGQDLLKEVAELTGLPNTEISEELFQLLDKVGADPDKLTIEELRAAMITYLSEVIGQEPEAPDSN